MVTAFRRLAPRLRESIAQTLGWSSLRPVQELSVHALLDGQNVVVLAPTAGGKTEAAIFPALHLLLEGPPDGVGVIYVAPIKALLNNQADRLRAYTEMVGLRRFVWHGDTAQNEKQRFIRDPAELLMTTPESLEVMLASARVPTRRLFSGLRLVIIDEIHAVAGTDRGAHLAAVLERLIAIAQRDVQRVGLSATVGNPKDILTWLSGSSKRERIVVDPPKLPTPRKISVSLDPEPRTLAETIGRRGLGLKSLVFCQSRSTTEAIALAMRGLGVDVFVHHSSVSLGERQAAEERFAAGRNAAIICTSTLELGIDVGDLDRVFQVEAPPTVSAFMQRMGRTGRRPDTHANTTFLCSDPETVLQAAALVELSRRGWVESVPTSGRVWPVLVHQLLSITLAHGAVTGDATWQLLSRVSDFRDVSHTEFCAVISHMVEHGYLFSESGRLSMGETAERQFGRKNFKELYSVFSSPVPFRVLTRNEQDLGSLDQLFVDRLEPGESAFVLGGRCWLALDIDLKGRRVVVEPAPKGKRPSWTSFVPQFLSREVCRSMQDVLKSGVVPAYVTGSAAQALADWQADFAKVQSAAIEVNRHESNVTWWTFAGGRINTTLRHAMRACTTWTVEADNLRVKVRSASFGRGSLARTLQEIADVDSWSELMPKVRAGLPAYRLSKFQDALPDWAQAELLEGYLLDLPGAQEVASEMLAAVRGQVPQPMSSMLK